jgi:hypothetical protein
MDRRRFLRGAAAAAISSALPGATEAKEKAELDILESGLTQEMLEHQKAAAVKSLIESVPPFPELEHIRAHTEYLSRESQMYIPGSEEIKDVSAKCYEQLKSLERTISLNGYGLLIYADTSSKDGPMQRMYVLRRVKPGAVQFFKGYRVSTSRAGFGNAANSGKTPLGLHSIPAGKRGAFGEVVAVAREMDKFVHVQESGVDRWFVRGFGEAGSDDIAEVVTDQYLLVGKTTDHSRGIRIHGTNRAGRLNAEGQWITFLGGRRRSGGCIRMSSTDIRDLYLSGYVALPSDRTAKKGSSHGSKTPVLIYATPSAIPGAESLTAEDMMDLPPRLKRPTEAASAEARHGEMSPRREPPANAPPRLRRP